ncbi:MAG TPA: hypothetical protein VFU22_08280 [Roseiflexaceae bacterium]|nr:hypothetical protein [Roseiflexaceae bacterium]
MTLLPYSPFGALLGFTPLPLSLLALIGGIAVLYILATELAKLEVTNRTEAVHVAMQRGLVE